MSGSEKAETKLTVGDVEVGVAVEVKSPQQEEPPPSSPNVLIVLLPLLVMVAVVWLGLQESPGSGESSRETPQFGIQQVGGLKACEPGIRVGGRVKTVAKVRMRSSPGYRGEDDTIGFCGSGERLLVLAGPSEKDDLCWWRVRDESSGKEGWMADHARGGLRLLKPSE